MSWPPSGLAAYLNALDQLDADEIALARQARLEDRADRPYDALDERPVPIRVAVHDTMRTVELALFDCADQIASAVQRPAARVKSAGPATKSADASHWPQRRTRPTPHAGPTSRIPPVRRRSPQCG
ncbi:hypothetical protein G4Z16_15365 [Streptomyces bathyalis]|uniref:Uncharacterized protein n=1 Tax=Streptomyces bathyalis TaxID=2710756 RepID=A0A7T1WSE9_9ACTN|nr:hypothetical protein [Streptomyces bathyalis]QPP07539.1 hypothetical protein G4Z16_15365 [Streptomyces bathyalis]